MPLEFSVQEGDNNHEDTNYNGRWEFCLGKYIINIHVASNIV